MASILIRNARVVNEGRVEELDVYIQDDLIHSIGPQINRLADRVVDARETVLLPGLIDDQVHFREPGLTHKADIFTESRAAVAGGITSFMEMPNTKPPATTQPLLAEKYRLGAEKSLANYSFYMGATNDNLEELLATSSTEVCGVKVFMGSSTGNMLVDAQEALENIFAQVPLLIATHCEDETTIQNNLAAWRERCGDQIPIEAHPQIRSADACWRSSSYAVELARKHGSRLHVLHISTARELELFDNSLPLEAKRITAEACIHHLWFSNVDYARLGPRIRWNPAVKTPEDRAAILQAVLDNRIDVIATDHAPHTLEEKLRPYTQAASGGPLVQHALVALLELYHLQRISLEKIVEKCCHGPAILFGIESRGFIREGYKADLVLVDLNHPWVSDPEDVLYKCGWSPFEGHRFKSAVTHTWVNGHLAYCHGLFDIGKRGERLTFRRN